MDRRDTDHQFSPKRRVTYIVSLVEKALAFEWICDNIDTTLIELDFLLLNPGDSELERELIARGIQIKRIKFRGYKDFPGAWIRVLRALRARRPDVLHAHMTFAALIGMTVAKLMGIPVRVFTRHHSTFHHNYAPRWVYVDRLLNRLATTVVAISVNVRDVLVSREKVRSSKIALIHHGFDLAAFTDVPADSVATIQAKYDLEGRHPVVGIIARYIHWKGIQYIVPALERLLEVYPNAVFVFANARDHGSIHEIVTTLPPSNTREVLFESDVFALYKVFDVYVHTPIDSDIEAFGQTYVEALAAGVPSIFSISGVAREFIDDERNALVVPHRDSDSIYRALVRILEDDALRKRLTEQGRADVLSRFPLHQMISKLEGVYLDRRPRNAS